MSQNRSAAVMQQRHEAADSLDDFPTPPWATRALCEALKQRGHPLHLQHAWEPCCNRGHMARPLGEYFDRVHATDVHDYGYPGQDGIADFLIDWGQDAPDVNWVIANPPFRLGAEFIQQGLRYARRGVAVFVRISFTEGAGRYHGLFRDTPEAAVLPFVERVVLWKGVLLDPDVPVWRPSRVPGAAGEAAKPSSATSYAWLLWEKDHAGDTAFVRIPPCRLALTRPGDYPPLPDHLRPPEGGVAMTPDTRLLIEACRVLALHRGGSAHPVWRSAMQALAAVLPDIPSPGPGPQLDGNRNLRSIALEAVARGPEGLNDIRHKLERLLAVMAVNDLHQAARETCDFERGRLAILRSGRPARD